MDARRFERRTALAALCTLPLACGSRPDRIVHASGVRPLLSDEIDRDPPALLPSGALGLVWLDAQRLFASPFGARLLAIARRAPVPPAAGFEPARDLQRLTLGLYSMQGVNAVAVATGSFNPSAIEQAADGVTATPLGAPVVRASYAGRSLYLSRNVGFVVLSPRTALFGDEPAIRRALDRIEEGRVRRDVPEWFAELLANPQAPIVMGGDFRKRPEAKELTRRMPFFAGLQTARVLGNFQDPGMNFAGTLGYESEAAAQQGAGAVRGVGDLLAQWGWIVSLIGGAQPFRRLDARPAGRDVQMVAELDGAGAAALVEQLGQALVRLPRGS
jgi:hypothetical protein